MVIDWLFLDTADGRKKNPAVASQRSLSDLEESSQETKVIMCLRESIKLLQRMLRKKQRKIEMGWMHFREGEFVQVRTKKGGGTRKESVLKDSKKQNWIEKAVQLFFPGGKNAEGSLTDFDIDLTDFQQHSLEDSITVGELYEKTKLPLLRFYLTTKKRHIASDINLEEGNSDAPVQEGEKTHDRPDIYRHCQMLQMSFMLEAAQHLQMEAVRVFPLFTPQSTQLMHLVCQNMKHYFMWML